MTKIPPEPTKSEANPRLSGYTAVAECEEIPEGGGRPYKISGKSIAIFRVHDRFYAINNICPHQGASLGKGKLKGYIVSCPLHDQQFDVRSGFGPDGGGYCVVRYDVIIYEGQVWVNLKRKDWFSGE